MTKTVDFLFLFFLDKDEEVYACCECNTGKKAYVLYTYHDQELAPHCKECFLDKMKKLEDRVMNSNSENYWQDGYRKLHKEYSYILRDNEHLKENVDRLVSDKMEMQYDIDVLKRHLELLERQIG
jgi:hypothetical protein